MATIGFIGVGNMGLPMALNLLEAGHDLRAFDRSSEALANVVAKGATRCDDARSTLDGSGVVITMLPAGEHVLELVAVAGDFEVLLEAESGVRLSDTAAATEPGRLRAHRRVLRILAPGERVSRAEAPGIRSLRVLPDLRERLRSLAEVTSDDLVYDLGCGNGIIVVSARFSM